MWYVCINSICYYCAQKPCLQGNGINLYTILFTVFSRHNCLIVIELWCKEMWQYSGICFLNISNYNLWVLLTPTGENKMTCEKVYCVCNFRRLQFSLSISWGHHGWIAVLPSNCCSVPRVTICVQFVYDLNVPNMGHSTDLQILFQCMIGIYIWTLDFYLS